MKPEPHPWTTSSQLSRLLRQCLEEGGTVEIDGLGVFRSRGRGRYQFQPEQRPRVFLAYVQEDRVAVLRLYKALEASGLDPWMDRKKLLPGQNWKRAIERAIQLCDFFIACHSRRSVGKRGRFQSELHYALDCATRTPFEDTWLIPVRLDECRVPARIADEFHYVDLFPEWEKGVARVVAVIRRQARKGSTASRPRASS